MKKPNLKISIPDLPEAGLELSGLLGPEEFNSLLAQTKNEFRFQGNISWRMNIERRFDNLQVTGNFHSRGTCLCSRCAKDLTLELEERFQRIFLPTPEDNPEAETDSDEVLGYYSGSELDLYPALTEEIMLSLPQKPLCREDCRGLCPDCGRDLNEETCDCASRRIDPRLAKLKGFKAEK